MKVHVMFKLDNRRLHYYTYWTRYVSIILSNTFLQKYFNYKSQQATDIYKFTKQFVYNPYTSHIANDVYF
jgi:hypothetical protein